MKIQLIFAYFLLWLAPGQMLSALAADGACPPVAPSPGQFGPFDYNDPDNKGHNLQIVEQYHFSPSVQLLAHGESGSVGSDLDYVLRAFPNHPRALNSMANLAIKEKKDRPNGAHFTVGCYFERAFGFAPSDAVIHMVYANYLYQIHKDTAALEQDAQAEKLDPQNANILYNEGLLYFNLKDYDKSLVYAQKAYAAGFPLPGLRNKLEKIGKWSAAN
ncbi:MAG: ABC transporter permease [Burkholderiales bacterium]